MLTKVPVRMAYENVSELLFGSSTKPVPCGFDLTIGAGHVFPEVNFTLPAITVEEATWSQVVAQYEDMATRILARAVSLRVPGIVLEFELLPAMTQTPEWGAELTRLLESHLRRAHEKHGLRCALRVTPTDIRDQGKPPLLRRGAPWETLKRSFELCIEAGAHLISIESIGGKELHDSGLDVWRHPGHRLRFGGTGSARHRVAVGPDLGYVRGKRPVRFRPETAPAVSPIRRCNWPTSTCCRRCWRRWCGP